MEVRKALFFLEHKFMTWIFHVATRLTMMHPHCYHHPNDLSNLIPCCSPPPSLYYSPSSSCCSQNTLGTFPTLSLCLAFPSPSNVLPPAICMSSPFTYFKSLLKSHFLRERRQSKMSSPRPEIFCIFLPFFYHVSTHLLTCYLMYLFIF